MASSAAVNGSMPSVSSSRATSTAKPSESKPESSSTRSSRSGASVLPCSRAICFIRSIMVNFMLIVLWPTVSSPAADIFAQDYNQVHDATVVNANGLFRSGNPLPTDRRCRYCRRGCATRPRVPEPHATVLVGRASPAGAARAAAGFPEIWLPSRKRRSSRRRAAVDLLDASRRRPARDPMQSVELVRRARLPRLRDAPGIAGTRRQGRHLYQRLGGAAHLADHRGAGFFALLRRRLRRSADVERPVR